MKIAIQLFGHLRTFEQCAPVLQQKLLSHYDCDIFIHTWSETEHCAKHQLNQLTGDIQSKQTNIIYDKIIQYYHPKKILIEEQEDFDIYNIYNPSASEKDIFKDFHKVSLNGQIYMLQSMCKSNNLRFIYQQESNINYDYVIFMRPDILLDEDFLITKYVLNFKYNPNIIISLSGEPTYTIQHRRFDFCCLANDIFYITTTNVADKIFLDYSTETFFRFYVNYINDLGEYNIHPEFAFHQMISSYGIHHQYYIFPYSLLRTNGEITPIKLEKRGHKDGYYNSNIMLDWYRFKFKYKKYKKLFIISLLLNIILVISLIFL